MPGFIHPQVNGVMYCPELTLLFVGCMDYTCGYVCMWCMFGAGVLISLRSPGFWTGLAELSFHVHTPPFSLSIPVCMRVYVYIYIYIYIKRSPHSRLRRSRLAPAALTNFFLFFVLTLFFTQGWKGHNSPHKSNGGEIFDFFFFVFKQFSRRVRLA